MNFLLAPKLSLLRSQKLYLSLPCSGCLPFVGSTPMHFHFLFVVFYLLLRDGGTTHFLWFRRFVLGEAVRVDAAISEETIPMGGDFLLVCMQRRTHN